MGKGKRFLTCVFSICACLIMAVSLTACGGKDFKTVKDYLESEDVQKELETQIETYKSQGVTLDVTADDSTLTYKYTYNVVMEPSDELTAEFDKEVEKVKDQMDDMIDQLSELVEVKNPSIVFEYYSSDGTKLYSCEFK